MKAEMSTQEHLELSEHYCAHNYHPLEVVLSRGEGVWAWDVEGRKYIDMFGAYSALSFGHRNPRFIQALIEQMGRLTMTGRAFHNDQLAPFCAELAALCGMDMVLPMNTGAEGVETAIKAARRWGYEKKGVPADRAEIIAFSGNFHGRTTTIVSFSDSPSAFKNYGPHTPGFHVVPYGDLQAVQAKLNDCTVGVLVEPIQGEGGIIIPPDGFLRDLRKLCSDARVMLLADEVQTGLLRTGKLFCCDWEGVKPDCYILGKALGGGLLPVSAVVGSHELLGVFTPGTHGSTFGGNPLSAALGREVVRFIKEEGAALCANANTLGAYAVGRLRALGSPLIEGIRQRGLMIGIDIDQNRRKVKDLCVDLLRAGVLTKDTREHTIRMAPPLNITREEMDWGLERIAKVLGGKA